MAMQDLNLLEFLGMKWSQEWVKDVKIRKKKKGLIKFVLQGTTHFREHIMTATILVCHTIRTNTFKILTSDLLCGANNLKTDIHGKVTEKTNC